MLYVCQSIASANAKHCKCQRKALHVPTQSIASVNAKHCMCQRNTIADKDWGCHHLNVNVRFVLKQRLNAIWMAFERIADTEKTGDNSLLMTFVSCFILFTVPVCKGLQTFVFRPFYIPGKCLDSFFLLEPYRFACFVITSLPFKEIVCHNILIWCR